MTGAAGITIWSAGGAATGCCSSGSWINGGGGGMFNPASTASSTRCRYAG